MSINTTLSNNNTFAPFQMSDRRKSPISNIDAQKKLLPSQIKSSPQSKLTVLGTTLAGTLLPMAMIAKRQKKDFNLKSWKNFSEIFKLKYGIPEMVIVSGGSIASGVAGGIISDKNHNKTHKIKEGVFQFMNATLPTLIVGGVVNLMEKSKKLKDNIPAKVGGIVGGLAIGMPIAAAVANRINDPNDEEPDRKIGFKDMIVSLDDALGALVLAKIPIVDKLHAEKFLPAIFAWCGYRAGEHK
ncbi:MAG: hypothetical protein PHE78_01480 [Candidatus Gastranaerophilales bacterium]|nr:hypothetical protein [Candidatus Gastranaerophilales bacterium]